jgi:phosphatidylserine/phosphatidylglycerophosphate/cardiolipin synthase-like enzyme
LAPSSLSRVARVLVQPRDGVAPVAALIDGARSAVAVKMFTLTAPALLDALVGAHARGVDVRVMLNPARSSGGRANDEAEERLRAAGVAVAWTNPRFAVTHEKSMVVDGRTALIATFNFCDKYFHETRDYGIVIEEPDTVREVLSGFEADWRRQEFDPPPGSALLWSSRNAREGMAAFIDSARHSLWVQHPKFSDIAILDRLMAARDRGVRLRVVCGGRHGISPPDMLDTFGALRVLQRSGVKVRKQHGLRLHAKLLIADDARALVGSMNIDRSAFDLRRELGAVVADPHALAVLRARFEADWDESRHYDPPDPMALHLHTEAALPQDADLDHE